VVAHDGGAEGFVAGDHVVEGGVEVVGVDRAGDPPAVDEGVAVAEGALGVALVERAQELLVE
jgi:hypothetical protein